MRRYSSEGRRFLLRIMVSFFTPIVIGWGTLAVIYWLSR